MEAIINIAYIAASILFVFGIKMLGSADTARRGNFISSMGMLLAVLVTLLDKEIVSYGWIAGGLAIGSAIGYFEAKRVQMTGMPEMVALFNGYGGLASLLVGWAEYARIGGAGWEEYFDDKGGFVMRLFTTEAISSTIFVGGITFTGSLVAYLKLSGKIGGKPTLFQGQKLINLLLFVLIAGMGILLLFAPQQTAPFYFLVVLSLALGVLAVIPIGGGDMPVVISLLNSFSGLAAAAAGFVILNNVLIVAGCLVGASGLILTVIMCKAMNRTLPDVLFSGFGAVTGGPASAIAGEMKAISVEDAYYVLEAASSVVFVPGYGMAVAQAQHAVKELGEILEENGTEVRYAIHPVAGRMPGHMNVLLAEADVPYEQLNEMDDVNPIIETVDVAIVIGANDVVNQAAAEDPSSPIYGMPIINVHKARAVFALKRGKGTGFSGLENALFFRDNCRMIYGDAKATMTSLVAQFKD